MGDHGAIPDIWQSDGRAKSVSGVPWQVAVACSLIRAGIDYKTTWTMPLALAIWHWAEFARQDSGKFPIVTQAEREAMEQMREEAANVG
jgi:hypothetical protein